MSPCCEFLIVDCCQFLSIGRENFFRFLFLRDWEIQKRLSATDNFFVSMADKKLPHASMWLCLQNEKNVVDQILFILLQQPNFWVCVSAHFRSFSPSVFRGRFAASIASVVTLTEFVEQKNIHYRTKWPVGSG